MANAALMEKARILIVEDEGIAAKDIQRILKKNGYSCIGTAASGEEAVKTAGNQHPDLVLMDIKLAGGMDGVEAAQLIRSQFSIPVVYLTAYADEKTLHRARITESYGYLLKPVEERSLKAAIEIAIYKNKAEVELSESEKRFRNLIEVTSDWVWEVDEKIVYTYVSPKIRSILGYEPEEVLGKTPFDLMAQDEAHRITDNFRSITASQEAFNLLESVNIHKDGHPVVMETSGVPLFDVNGKFLGYRGIDRDITERMRAEEEIRKNEKRYRRLFEQSNDGIMIHTLDSDILDVNERMLEMLGYDRDQLLNLPAVSLHPEEDLPFLVDVFRDIQKGDWVQLETRYLKADGTIIDVEIRSRLVEPEKGIVQAVIRDITEQKRAAEELLRITKAVENASDAIGMSDPQGRHFYQNRAFTDLFGYTVDELEAAGGGPVVYMDPDVAGEMFENIMNGGSWIGEVEMMSKSGRTLPIFLRADAIKDDAGNIIGLVGVHTDITEQKRIEHMKDTLLRDISHELKHPVAMAKMEVEVLKRKAADQERLQDYLMALERSIDRMKGSLDRIMAFSYDDAAEETFKKSSVSFQGIIDEITAEFNEAILTKGIVLDIRADPRLPDLHGNFDQIRRMLQNLVENALKFTPEEGRIEISARSRENFLECTVQDTGCGIPLDHLHMVFERFFKGHGNVPGVGLGLTICKDIVENHGGKIKVESEGEGKGVAVIFTIPLAQ